MRGKSGSESEIDSHTEVVRPLSRVSVLCSFSLSFFVQEMNNSGNFHKLLSGLKNNSMSITLSNSLRLNSVRSCEGIMELFAYGFLWL